MRYLIRLVVLVLGLWLATVVVANTIFGPQVPSAEILSCELSATDAVAGSPHVTAEVRVNRATGFTLGGESYRIHAFTEGGVAPVARWSSARSVPPGGLHVFVVPMDELIVRDPRKASTTCLVFAAGDAPDPDDGIFEISKAIDRRQVSVSPSWDLDRRVVFLSGVGTDSATAAGTFEQMAARFASQLRAPSQFAFIHFSYAGTYDRPAVATAPPTGARPVPAGRGSAAPSRPIARPTRRSNAAPLYVSTDVCAGARVAGDHLRTLLESEGQSAEFDLVGHSFGGFVAMHFLGMLQEQDGADLLRRIHSVTTLDSPLAGYPSAPFLGTDNAQASLMSLLLGCGATSQMARDLVQGSDATRTIAKLEEARPLMHVVTVGNNADLLVPAAIAHKVSSGSDAFPLDGYCVDPQGFHGCVLRHPELIDRVVGILGRRWVERPGDDHGDQTATATQISVDVRGGSTGRLERSTDVDVFHIGAVAGTTYGITVALGTHPDVAVRLRDGAGVTLRESDDIAPGNLSARVEWTAASAMDVYLEVRSAPASLTGTGSYTISVVASALQDLALTVRPLGSGRGTVTSADGRSIRCAPTCETTLRRGTRVTLLAQPSQGSAFVGWGGDCAAQRCDVVMDQQRLVAATFETIQPPQLVERRTTCVAGRTEVRIGWTAPSGANLYAVRRDLEPYGGPTEKAFTDRTPVPGQTHRYDVAAIYPDGSRSVPSQQYEVSIPAACR